MYNVQCLCCGLRNSCCYATVHCNCQSRISLEQDRNGNSHFNILCITYQSFSAGRRQTCDFLADNCSNGRLWLNALCPDDDDLIWEYFCISLTFRLTRKPCYRKDDRAMRPIYGYPEKFRESSQPPPATTFPEICKGLFVPIDTKNVHTKFEVHILSVPEIIGGTQKIWAVPRYAHDPFYLKFLRGFCSDGPCEYTCQIWSS